MTEGRWWRSSLAAGTESSPPGARPTSTSDLVLNACCVVCPSPLARLVVAPTLAKASASGSGLRVDHPCRENRGLPVASRATGPSE